MQQVCCRAGVHSFKSRLRLSLLLLSLHMSKSCHVCHTAHVRAHPPALCAAAAISEADLFDTASEEEARLSALAKEAKAGGSSGNMEYGAKVCVGFGGGSGPVCVGAKVSLSV